MPQFLDLGAGPLKGYGRNLRHCQRRKQVVFGCIQGSLFQCCLPISPGGMLSGNVVQDISEVGYSA